MIAQLRGTVVDIGGPTLTLDVNGVGYEVIGSRSLLEKVELGATHQVVIYTDVKEDSIRLFGFTDALEKQVFLMLLKVSGVGSKTALDLVSGLAVRELLRAIGEGDAHRLQGIKGVGKKTAERVILELRDKMASVATEFHGEHEPSRGQDRAAFMDAIRALQALGFSASDAETAVRAVEQSGKLPQTENDAGVIVKEALRFV